MRRNERAELVLGALKEAYPDSHCALVHGNAFELLVATILSAQCTDVRVNMVTPALFKKYPTPQKMAKADPDTLMELIRSTGFYRNKAKSILAAANRIVDVYGGEVPDTMDDLLSLAGVARKTANVVLGNAFNKNVGVVVDTHVSRLSNRIGLTKHSDTNKIERDLMKHFPQEDWTMLSHHLIDHGRNVCVARWPRCEACPLGERLCRSYEPDMDLWKKRAKKKAAKKRASA